MFSHSGHLDKLENTFEESRIEETQYMMATSEQIDNKSNQVLLLGS